MEGRAVGLVIKGWANLGAAAGNRSFTGWVAALLASLPADDAITGAL